MALSADDRYYIKLKASYLYYYENYTQKQIAEQLKVSRTTLNKLLGEARKDGTVQIEIHDKKNFAKLIELENALCKKFNFKGAKVVDCLLEDNDIVKDRIGKAAATYFDKLIRSGMCVGIGWGKTIERMAGYVTPLSNVTNSEFVTILGGSGNLEYQIHANSLTEKISNLYNNSTNHHIYAPMVASNQKLSEALKNDEGIKKVMNKMNFLDLVIIGIDGDSEASTTVMTGNIPKHYLDLLDKAHSVGNICARFYDIEGNICVKELNDRVTAIPLDVLKKTPLVMAVAGGKRKIKSMIGGARGGYYNILVTDERTAKAMLNY